ncbi:MAG: hypothetical protein DRP86_08485 [Candidatus Neomarinimicrobiota bacterium]|mgnify:CR=1 FL=1|nr:MAG: hypothetical protein DRP86_08485 [Candidatus Neomarinimicrobiota bacterium]
MKTKLSLLNLVLIVLGCSKIWNDGPSGIKVYGSWVVTSYHDLTNDSIIEKKDVDSWGMDVKIKFMRDSTFCGFCTNNEIAGHYTLADSCFNIDVYGGSKVGQPEWGDLFSDIALSHSFTCYKRNNKELRLYYDDNNKYVLLNLLDTDIRCTITYSSPSDP